MRRGLPRRLCFLSKPDIMLALSLPPWQQGGGEVNEYSDRFLGGGRSKRSRPLRLQMAWPTQQRQLKPKKDTRRAATLRVSFLLGSLRWSQCVLIDFSAVFIIPQLYQHMQEGNKNFSDLPLAPSFYRLLRHCTLVCVGDRRSARSRTWNIGPRHPLCNAVGNACRFDRFFLIPYYSPRVNDSMN